MAPWGSGPEPTDHEFMRRLFKKWDVEHEDQLSLQNVVNGMAAVKGSKDIMSNIEYFFDLYDDDKDGKVDREGILRMSEALLFLSRRGLGAEMSPNPSVMDLQPNGTGETKRENKDELFLSAVSEFIRRCFEYADPDHPANADLDKETDAAATAVDAFSIGDDEDEGAEDLLDLENKPDTPKKTMSTPTTSTAEPPSQLSKAATAPSDRRSANAALDPAHPLFITLPTFRMLILADEALESFFDSTFANSFKLSDTPSPSSASSSSNLTTFANLGRKASMPLSVAPVGPGTAGVVAPSKGIRGMLDNIVNDGMRVAAEVRRRMDEAQKELDAASKSKPEEEEEDDENADVDLSMGAGLTSPTQAYGGDAERKSIRSVKESDRELLEGADAEAGVGLNEGKVENLMDSPVEAIPRRATNASEASADKVVEFER